MTLTIIQEHAQIKKPPNTASVSQLNKLGKEIRERLKTSNRLRRKFKYNNKADEEVLAAIGGTSERMLNTYAMRKCQNATQKMEEVLFFSRVTERLVTMLHYFYNRPQIRELAAARVTMDTDDSSVYFPKQKKINATIVKNLTRFLGMFCRCRHDGDKGGERRTLGNQNVYGTVISGLNNGDLTKDRFERLVCRTLQVSRRQVRRNRAMRQEMENKDTANWVCTPSSVPKK